MLLALPFVIIRKILKDENIKRIDKVIKMDKKIQSIYNKYIEYLKGLLLSFTPVGKIVKALIKDGILPKVEKI